MSNSKKGMKESDFFQKVQNGCKLKLELLVEAYNRNAAASLYFLTMFYLKIKIYNLMKEIFDHSYVMENIFGWSSTEGAVIINQ